MKKLPHFNAAFAQVLRAHRERAGITQPQLAEMIEGSELTIRTLERGKQTPTVTTLLLIAESLQVDARDMLGQVMLKMEEMNDK